MSDSTPPAGEPPSLEEIVIGELLAFARQQAAEIHERQMRQAKVIDARLASVIRMMRRLQASTQEAVTELERRQDAVEARVLALEGGAPPAEG